MYPLFVFSSFWEVLDKSSKWYGRSAVINSETVEVCGLAVVKFVDNVSQEAEGLHCETPPMFGESALC